MEPPTEGLFLEIVGAHPLVIDTADELLGRQRPARLVDIAKRLDRIKFGSEFDEAGPNGTTLFLTDFLLRLGCVRRGADTGSGQTEQTKGQGPCLNVAVLLSLLVQQSQKAASPLCFQAVGVVIDDLIQSRLGVGIIFFEELDLSLAEQCPRFQLA